jgi:choline dehydrogenase-like flavoprotein
VSDNRWTYEGFLPYFRRIEHHFDPGADPLQHGFNGPMHTVSVSASGRQYPLREMIFNAWTRLGLKRVDANTGAVIGIAELVENRRDGLRQLTSVIYPLKGVHVLTETLVHRILFNNDEHHPTATGVELADNRKFHIKVGGEVILSAGGYRSPQLLMLSGIGHKEELNQHGIPVVKHHPEVGKNFHDHLDIHRYWKLRHPEKGLAVGSPALMDPVFLKGNPIDWMVGIPVDAEGLESALARDEGRIIGGDHALVSGPRPHLEMCVTYMAVISESIGLNIPLDGASIETFCMACLPTSRGTITLGSPDPTKPPLINPNYYATDADRYVMREGWHVASRLMLETPEGKELVAEEIVPEGHKQLGSDAADELIDARIRMGAVSAYHPAGAASMGKVVDGSLKVYGIKSLRVVDASVIPVPISGHYQAVVLALAEQAVDIILAEREMK